MNGWMNWVVEWMDGSVNGWANGRINGWMDRWAVVFDEEGVNENLLIFIHNVP